MPTPTYTPLANITLGSSASSVTFSSISGAYRDLVLVISTYTNSTGAGEAVVGRFNSDAGSNYSQVRAWAGSSGSTGSNSGTGTEVEISRSWTTNSGNTSFWPIICQIMDYSATDKHKTLIGRGGAVSGDSLVQMNAGRWASTSAITSIFLFPAAGPNFVAGSTFALYGIAS